MRYSPIVIPIIILCHIKYSFWRGGHLKSSPRSSEVNIWKPHVFHTKITLVFYQTWHFSYWQYALLYRVFIYYSLTMSVSSCISESALRHGSFNHCSKQNAISQVSSGRQARSWNSQRQCPRQQGGHPTAPGRGKQRRFHGNSFSREPRLPDKPTASGQVSNRSAAQWQD